VVSLIPTTLELTTLGHRQPGDPVNLEVDVVAKYVERLASPHLAVHQTAGQQADNGPVPRNRRTNGPGQGSRS
jgi:riboflavin synthase